MCCFVADMGRGRAAPLSDLLCRFLDRAVRDRRRRTMPRLRAPIVAHPSNTSFDHPGIPDARRRCFPAGPDHEECSAAHPGSGHRTKAVPEKAEVSPTGALDGGSLGRLARHLSTPPFDFTSPTLAVSGGMRRLGAWFGAVPGTTSRAGWACGLRFSYARGATTRRTQCRGHLLGS